MRRLPSTIGIICPFVLHPLVGSVQDLPHHVQAIRFLKVRDLQDLQQLLRTTSHLGVDDQRQLRIRQAVQLLGNHGLLLPRTVLMRRCLAATSKLFQLQGRQGSARLVAAAFRCQLKLGLRQDPDDRLEPSWSIHTGVTAPRNTVPASPGRGRNFTIIV